MLPTWNHTIIFISKVLATALKTVPRASWLKSLIHCSSLPITWAYKCSSSHVYVKDRMNKASANAVTDSSLTMWLNWSSTHPFFGSTLVSKLFRDLVISFDSCTTCNDAGTVDFCIKLQLAISMNPFRIFMSRVDPSIDLQKCLMPQLRYALLLAILMTRDDLCPVIC
jgi:hypothetical protein